MEILVSNKFLGTQHHLLYDGCNFTWTNVESDNTWRFGFDKSTRDLELISIAAGYSLNTFEKSSHGRAIRSIIDDRTVSIPWMYVMPKDVFNKQLTDLLDQLWVMINDNSNAYYINQFLSNRELLASLERPHVDIYEIKKVSESGDTKSEEVLKFLPESGGNKAPKTTYSQIGSITGRLTVKTGPNILTLKKEHRRIFKSRFENGKIIQIDISSLEPRIALAISGKTVSQDIYKLVGSAIGGELTREQVKIAVFSCIYGASSWSLSKKLPDNLDAKKIMFEINNFFGIPDLKSRLDNEIKSHGHIKNMHGRVINSKDSFVNHFLQSSGVDVSFDVFSQIIDRLKRANIDFVPIYVIHDAIVLDIPNYSESLIKEIIKNGFIIDKINCTFPVKIETIKE